MYDEEEQFAAKLLQLTHDDLTTREFRRLRLLEIMEKGSVDNVR